MRFSVLLLAALLPLSCAAEPIPEPVPEFETVMDEVQFNFEQADRAVAETFHLIIQKIDAGEYEDYMVPIPVLDESLMGSQMAWEEYRDAHCQGVQTLMSSGTSGGADYLECLTDLNQKREQQLHDLYLYDREDSHSVDCCNKEDGSETGLWDLAPD